MEKNCYTCQVPARDVINSAACAGWRERDGGVTAKTVPCPTWKVAADTWSVTEAIAYVGIVFHQHMSRPTMIKLCRRHRVCTRKRGGLNNHWEIDAARLVEVMQYAGDTADT